MAGGDLGAVINLAGMLGTPELLGDERAACEVNIIGAVNVYDAAARRGIPVVQIGTGHKGQPNPYAITKACAEDLGLARARWLGEKITVVRAYHVYGPGQLPGPPHGPASVHKFFPTFACRALSGAAAGAVRRRRAADRPGARLGRGRGPRRRDRRAVRAGRGGRVRQARQRGAGGRGHRRTRRGRDAEPIRATRRGPAG